MRTVLKPGDDIQAAIDATSKTGGGVVLLAEGTYDLHKRLDLRDKVVVRGTNPEKTILRNLMRAKRRSERQIVGIAFPRISHAGLEDLTILHPAVEALDPKSYASYQNDHDGLDDLQVGHLCMWFSHDCWVDNCRFLYAGTDPIVLSYCTHVTFRDNLVKHSFNKGDGGNGYYRTTHSQFVLFCNEAVIGLRHFTLQNGTTYCVVYNCYFEVDVNFHCGDDGHNLIEGCLIQLPKRHMWPPICHGKPEWKPPGPDNLLYRIVTRRDGSAGPRETRIHKGVASDPTAVFTLKRTLDDPPVVQRLSGPPPRHGTLYPVTGACPSSEELGKLYRSFAEVAGPKPPAAPPKPLKKTKAAEKAKPGDTSGAVEEEF